MTPCRLSSRTNARAACASISSTGRVTWKTLPRGGSSTAARAGAASCPSHDARTALQTYLYAFAKGRPGAVVWIVDDDMRLDPLVAGKDGRLQRRPLNLVPMLQDLRKRHASGDVDIAIGAYSGAPPLPFAATVRVQLVDLVASLQWLAAQDPEGGPA